MHDFIDGNSESERSLLRWVSAFRLAPCLASWCLEPRLVPNGSRWTGDWQLTGISWLIMSLLFEPILLRVYRLTVTYIGVNQPPIHVSMRMQYPAISVIDSGCSNPFFWTSVRQSDRYVFQLSNTFLTYCQTSTWWTVTRTNFWWGQSSWTFGWGASLPHSPSTETCPKCWGRVHVAGDAVWAATKIGSHPTSMLQRVDGLMDKIGVICWNTSCSHVTYLWSESVSVVMVSGGWSMVRGASDKVIRHR